MTGRAQGGGPLAGLAVVVTRPAGPVGAAVGGAEPLRRALAAGGAEVRHVPMVAFAPALDPQPLEEALDRWEDYDWVAFTSRTPDER